MNIKAAMFDYDGTLTERGAYYIDNELVDVFAKLLERGFPLAVCTGRQLESFEGRFVPVRERLVELVGVEALKNFYLMAENGAVGYEWSGGADVDAADGATGEWRVFYKAEWPKDIPRDKFKEDINGVVGDKGEILDHLVPIVLGPWGRQEMHIDMINEKSAEVFKIVKKFLEEYPVVEAETGLTRRAIEYFHLGDSGLGCLICPIDADKDTAIRVFYEFLKEGKGVVFDEAGASEGRCREIMVVGDNPQTGGNDYYFLNGRYGTSFTVGEAPDDGAEMPLEVIDEEGKRLKNSKGCLYLLNKVLQSAT